MNNSNISPSVILKSRIRLARNIIDYPFSPVLNDACRKEIIEKVNNALADKNYKRLDASTDSIPYLILSEENKISREFAGGKERRSLFYREDEAIYIMVCEEDHLRLQAFSDGFDLRGAYERIRKSEKMLGEHINFAFDSNLGYLTHCPTNLGTAMRASVMMFLPGLTLGKRMGDLKSQLEKIGVTIRGIYGEGSSADAFIYQISNSLSLGISEEDIINKIQTIAERIANDELETRKSLFNINTDKLTDKVMRSLGILSYSHLLSSAEFLECYAYTRLGICLGLIDNIVFEKLDKLLHLAMPAHIVSKCADSATDSILRDKLRASTVKESFKEE